MPLSADRYAILVNRFLFGIKWFFKIFFLVLHSFKKFKNNKQNEE